MFLPSLTCENSSYFSVIFLIFSFPLFYKYFNRDKSDYISKNKSFVVSSLLFFIILFGYYFFEIFFAFPFVSICRYSYFFTLLCRSNSYFNFYIFLFFIHFFHIQKKQLNLKEILSANYMIYLD